MSLPKEVLEIAPEVRERIRQALLACAAAGEPITVRNTRSRAQAAVEHVAAIVRLAKAEVLKLDEPWGLGEGAAATSPPTEPSSPMLSNGASDASETKPSETGASEPSVPDEPLEPTDAAPPPIRAMPPPPPPGAGRKEVAENRQRRILCVLLATARSSDAVRKMLAAKLSAPLETIQRDVDALTRELSTEPSAPSARTTTLINAIKAAQTEAEFMACDQEVMAMIVEHEIDSATADNLRAFSAECRQKLKAIREQRGEEGGSPGFYCTQECVAIVEAFERIINGHRRRKIAAFVEAEAAEDQKDFPPEVRLDPEAGNRKLEELELNAFGDPKEEEA